MIRVFFAVLVLLVAIAIGAIDLFLRNHDTLFKHEDIANIARAARSNQSATLEDMFANITATLRQRYPGAILDNPEWVFINAGGWMGAFQLLHASVTEYVLLFGTATRTSGHSGRYWADIHDTLLTGEFRQWKEGTVRAFVHHPGDEVIHYRLEATSVTFADDTWMLEYAHGFIPSTMPFALSDSFFSTQDFLTVAKSFKIYGGAVIQQLLRGKV